MKHKILDAGLQVYPNVTITNIANVLGVSTPSVFYHFKSNEILEAVEEYAVEIEHKQVIAQMITAKSDKMNFMTDKEKLKYLVDSV